MGTPQLATDDFSWKETWDVWDVRVIVLSTLFLQTFLLFSGPLRKKTQRGIVTVLIWTAYILSPIICTYGFGLITTSIVTPTPKTRATLTDPSPSPSPTTSTAMPDRGYTHPYILSLWSPLLLLHLSRPDTITALSIADNDLWVRKGIYITLYCFYVGRSIILSAIFSSKLWISAAIVYLIGLKRYIIWVDTLYFATTVGTDGYLPEKPLLGTTSQEEDLSSHDLSDIQVIKHAYRFFTQFKGLIVGYSYTFSNCTESGDFFIKLTPKDAFRVVERELIFFYEFIYTKPWIMETRSSYLLRIEEFLALWVAFLLFYKVDKSLFENNDIDIKITYLLLGGSIFLEASAIIMVLSSDWFVVQLKSRDRLSREIGKYLEIFKTWWPKIVHRKWSNSLPQYNLLKYCLRPKTKERSRNIPIVITMPLKTIESIRFVETLKFDEGMRDFIIAELKKKSLLSNNPSTAREIQSAKGDWVLRDESCMQLLTWINGCDFDQILVMWHVATDICFHTDNRNNNDRKISKCLSDYMFYLLIWQPEMMSSVDARGASWFKVTSDEVRKFFHDKNIKVRKGEKVDEVLNKACENIVSGYTEVNGGLSVMMSVCNLVEKLIELEDTRKWEILSKVWVEMLCYAASHCKASAHIEQIQKGGQLLTFVWLLMVHFGIVN